MAKTNESDVWGQEPPGSGRAGPTFVRQTLSVKQTVKVVRDDWDDDDDEEEEQEGIMGNDRHGLGSTNPKDGTAPLGRVPSGAEDESSKVWEEANKRAPMPELVVASASTGQGFAPPPAAALQPTLRILKRPPANASVGASSGSRASSELGSPSSSGTGSPAPRGTLAEREAQYQEARSRIFGEKYRAVSRTSSSSGGGGVSIVRDPLGPAFESAPEAGVGGPGRPVKGFGERRRGMQK